MNIKELSREQLLELANALQEAGISLPKARKAQARAYLSVSELANMPEGHMKSLGCDFTKILHFAKAVSEAQAELLSPFYRKRFKSQPIKDK